MGRATPVYRTVSVTQSIKTISDDHIYSSSIVTHSEAEAVLVPACYIQNSNTAEWTCLSSLCCWLTASRRLHVGGKHVNSCQRGLRAQSHVAGRSCTTEQPVIKPTFYAGVELQCCQFSNTTAKCRSLQKTATHTSPSVPSAVCHVSVWTKYRIKK